ncbi:MAG: AmmeMemoRadiSam system protein B [Dehalococcoidia bacterium]|nr:AmmeMemoRadiSam system protein B [Dehalococcoidia bacterium]
MNRKPTVAGTFYPASSQALAETVSNLADPANAKVEAIGIVSPHAGYTYSGSVAGAVISRVRLEDTVIILGPNHTGLGVPFSLWPGDTWETPLGNVAIDDELRHALLINSAYLAEDADAHLREHSLEVQLPFLQHQRSGIKIVPIVLGGAAPGDYQALGGEIARVLTTTGQRATILASSDMTHYEPHAAAEHKDRMAIEAITRLNAAELISCLTEHRITMCGYAPTLTLIAAAKQLGATAGELVRYQTSGDVSGDYESVVGYAGIVIKR